MTTIPIRPGFLTERWWILNGNHRYVFPAPFGVPEWIDVMELGGRVCGYWEYAWEEEDENEG